MSERMLTVEGLSAWYGAARILYDLNLEVGRGEVGKGGVVRDTDKHREVILAIKSLAEGLGLKVGGVTESPVLGPKGNREFLILMAKTGESEPEQEK